MRVLSGNAQAITDVPAGRPVSAPDSADGSVMVENPDGQLGPWKKLKIFAVTVISPEVVVCVRYARGPTSG